MERPNPDLTSKIQEAYTVDRTGMNSIQRIGVAYCWGILQKRNDRCCRLVDEGIVSVDGDLITDDLMILMRHPVPQREGVLEKIAYSVGYISE